MDPVTIVLIVGVVLAFILLIVGVVLSLRGGESQIESRLETFTTQPREEDKKRKREIEEEARRLSQLTKGVDKVLTRRGFGERIATELARADLKLTVTEFLMLKGGSVVLFGLLGQTLFANVLFAIMGAVVGFFVPDWIVKYMQGRRLKRFNDQLGDTINLMVNGLRSGYSMLQALESVAKELPPPASTEFRRVVQEVGLGLSIEQALANMQRRIRSDDLDLMITAINVQHEVGGNLAEILDVISYTIRERVRIQGEIKVLTAQGMISGYVISFLPVALMLILYMINKPYVGRMFTHPCGWAMLGTCVITIGLGFFAIQKIVRIEV